MTLQEFEDAVPKIKQAVLRVCARYSFRDTEEILQETLIRVWQYRHQFRGEASVDTWAWTIATNRVRDHLRKGKVRESFSVPTINEEVVNVPCRRDNPLKQLLRKEITVRVHLAAEKLSPLYKDAFDAAIDEVPVGQDATLKTRHYRMRQLMIPLLKRQGVTHATA